eukprot:scaffold7044_cov216-Pinguiococcus_pyrenoidosus.AAC.10
MDPRQNPRPPPPTPRPTGNPRRRTSTGHGRHYSLEVPDGLSYMIRNTVEDAERVYNELLMHFPPWSELTETEKENIDLIFMMHLKEQMRNLGRISRQDPNFRASRPSRGIFTLAAQGGSRRRRGGARTRRRTKK